MIEIFIQKEHIDRNEILNEIEGLQIDTYRWTKQNNRNYEKTRL